MKKDEKTQDELLRIYTGVLRDAADRYRDRKGTLHKFFKNVAGESRDLVRARQRTPLGVKPEEWDKCIELFTDPAFVVSFIIL